VSKALDHEHTNRMWSFREMYTRKR
jgi:hypothetical protein